MTLPPDTTHVLHVDDEPGFAETAAEFLRRADDRFVVTTATSAEEGLDVLDRSPVDCVVSDYEMPGLNGVEFLRAVREDRPHLPFVLFSGKGSEAVASEAISAGVTDYVPKAGDRATYDRLADRIRDAVERYRAGHAAGESRTGDADDGELRRARARFDQLLDTSPVGITLLDTDGVIVRANRRAEVVLGLSESAITDRTYDDPAWRIVDEDGETIPESDLPFSRVMATGEPVFDYEHAIRWPDGSERWLSINAGPLFGTDGGVKQVIAVITDITDRRAHERRIERQNARLEEFVGVVSHDLRNPLNVAQGRLELARTECDSAHLDSAVDAVDRSLELVEDLLSLAREGKVVGEVESVALAAVVEECWAAVATDDATLVVDADSTVRADRSRLRQLFENLLRNGVEHGSAGSDGVTVTVGDLDGGFYVEDDGPGIPESDRDRVFEAGYSTLGGGFGLDIVRDVAEAHGWTVAVTESDAGGARFVVTGVEVA